MEPEIFNAFLAGAVGVVGIIALMWTLDIFSRGRGTRSHPVLNMYQTLVELTREEYGALPIYPTLPPDFSDPEL